MVESALIKNNKIGRVLITGASQGIGRELAQEFARRGHDLILVSRSKDKLDELAAELKREFKTNSLVVPQDLTKPTGPANLLKKVEEAGETIAVLVNNAGALEVGAFVEMPTEKIVNLVNLNVAALTTLTSLVLPGMVERGSGRILNVASLAAFQPLPAMAAYAASKAYVLALTEALSEELKGSGVTVTALCPGLTETAMVQNIKAQSEVVARTPGMLISDPKEVAQLAYKGVMSGRVIVVPGIGNQLTAAWSQVNPRWLVRNVAGFLTRQTVLSKR